MPVPIVLDTIITTIFDVHVAKDPVVGISMIESDPITVVEDFDVLDLDSCGDTQRISFRSITGEHCVLVMHAPPIRIGWGVLTQDFATGPTDVGGATHQNNPVVMVNARVAGIWIGIVVHIQLGCSRI
jgi:hypothetical protein